MVQVDYLRPIQELQLKLINPIVPNYKLINTPNDKTNHIVSAKVKHYRKEEYPEGITPEEIRYDDC